MFVEPSGVPGGWTYDDGADDDDGGGDDDNKTTTRRELVIRMKRGTFLNIISCMSMRSQQGPSTAIRQVGKPCSSNNGNALSLCRAFWPPACRSRWRAACHPTTASRGQAAPHQLAHRSQQPREQAATITWRTIVSIGQSLQAFWP